MKSNLTGKIKSLSKDDGIIKLKLGCFGTIETKHIEAKKVVAEIELSAKILGVSDISIDDTFYITITNKEGLNDGNQNRSEMEI